MPARCAHLDQIKDVEPGTPNGCEECLKMGGVGPPPPVSDLRPRRLLRQLAQEARDEAFPRDRRTRSSAVRAGRGLGLVLRRRADHRARAARNDGPVRPARGRRGRRCRSPGGRRHATLHMWTQIVGKTRLALAPMENHWWQVALYVTPRGLTTSAMPSRHPHVRGGLRLPRPPPVRESQRRRDAPRSRSCRRSVADFYAAYMATAAIAGARGPDPAHAGRGRDRHPVRPDREHASYDADAANRCWRLLVAGRPRAQAVPRPFRRQGQPRALLLGELRPGVRRGSRDAPHRCIPAAPRTARLRHARGVLARVQQLRLLARRRRGRGARVLRLRVSRAARIRRPSGASRRRALRSRCCASSFCRTSAVRTAADPG